MNKLSLNIISTWCVFTRNVMFRQDFIPYIYMYIYYYIYILFFALSCYFRIKLNIPHSCFFFIWILHSQDPPSKDEISYWNPNCIVQQRQDIKTFKKKFNTSSFEVCFFYSWNTLFPMFPTFLEQYPRDKF